MNGTLRAYWRAVRLGAASACALLALGQAPARAQVQVGTSPVYQVVPVNTDFFVDVRVLQAGPSFNAYEAIVTFDPAAISYVSVSPISLQEGTYMTSACGTRFHRFNPGAGSDTVAHSLLCNGVTLTGPGQLYHLKFHTSGTPQLTFVRLAPGVKFYNAGVLVASNITQEAEINIGNVAAVESPEAALAPRLRTSPNPSRGATALAVEAARRGAARLEVFSASGRRVRDLSASLPESGSGSVRWDGRDESGRTVAAGIYVARLSTRSRAVESRIAILH